MWKGYVVYMVIKSKTNYSAGWEMKVEATEIKKNEGIHTKKFFY